MTQTPPLLSRRGKNSAAPRIISSLVGSTLICTALAFLPGCAHLRPAKAPIPTLNYRAATATPASTLIVLLPGRGGSMRDFERHGFLTELERAGIVADAVAVDAHLGYYYRRTIIDRLSADVLQPARSQGYKRIVVVGISLGGLGGVLCSRDAPQLVDALVLLSPYLGDDKDLFEKIRVAGGPIRWAAGQESGQGKVADEVWTFIGQHSADLPPTWLLSGTRDYLSEGQKLLAGLLPPDHVVTIEGAHNWKTWEALWKDVCFSTDVFKNERRPAAVSTAPRHTSAPGSDSPSSAQQP